MAEERVYVYFKPGADAAARWLEPWLQAAQRLVQDTPGLQLECLQRVDAGAVTWMEVYCGLPLHRLHAASQAMAGALATLQVQRHQEVFERVVAPGQK